MRTRELVGVLTYVSLNVYINTNIAIAIIATRFDTPKSAMIVEWHLDTEDKVLTSVAPVTFSFLGDRRQILLACHKKRGDYRGLIMKISVDVH